MNLFWILNCLNVKFFVDKQEIEFFQKQIIIDLKKIKYPNKITTQSC